MPGQRQGRVAKTIDGKENRKDWRKNDRTKAGQGPKPQAPGSQRLLLRLLLGGKAGKISMIASAQDLHTQVSNKLIPNKNKQFKHFCSSKKRNIFWDTERFISSPSQNQFLYLLAFPMHTRTCALPCTASSKMVLLFPFFTPQHCCSLKSCVQSSTNSTHEGQIKVQRLINFFKAVTPCIFIQRERGIH